MNYSFKVFNTSDTIISKFQKVLLVFFGVLGCCSGFSQSGDIRDPLPYNWSHFRADSVSDDRFLYNEIFKSTDHVNGQFLKREITFHGEITKRDGSAPTTAKGHVRFYFIEDNYPLPKINSSQINGSNPPFVIINLFYPKKDYSWIKDLYTTNKEFYFNYAFDPSRNQDSFQMTSIKVKN